MLKRTVAHWCRLSGHVILSYHTLPPFYKRLVETALIQSCTVTNKSRLRDVIKSWRSSKLTLFGSLPAVVLNCYGWLFWAVIRCSPCCWTVAKHWRELITFRHKMSVNTYAIMTLTCVPWWRMRSQWCQLEFYVLNRRQIHISANKRMNESIAVRGCTHRLLVCSSRRGCGIIDNDNDVTCGITRSCWWRHIIKLLTKIEPLYW